MGSTRLADPAPVRDEDAFATKPCNQGEGRKRANDDPEALPARRNRRNGLATRRETRAGGGGAAESDPVGQIMDADAVMRNLQLTLYC